MSSDQLEGKGIHLFRMFISHNPHLLPHPGFTVVHNGTVQNCASKNLIIVFNQAGVQYATSIIVIIISFYMALFSALEQTHCARWHVILNE